MEQERKVDWPVEPQHPKVDPARPEVVKDTSHCRAGPSRVALQRSDGEVEGIGWCGGVKVHAGRQGSCRAVGLVAVGREPYPAAIEVRLQVSEEVEVVDVPE